MVGNLTQVQGQKVVVGAQSFGQQLGRQSLANAIRARKQHHCTRRVILVAQEVAAEHRTGYLVGHFILPDQLPLKNSLDALLQITP